MLRKLAICLFLLAGGVAWAGPSEADIEAAKVHYQSGAKYYEAGAYDEAIREFHEAYRLSKAPALLYNLSQAYDKKGDYANARDNLKRYIDSGNAEEGEMPQLQEKLRAYDQRLRGKPPEPKQTAPKTAPPEPRPAPAPAPPPEAVTPPPPRPAGSGPPFKVWKWVAGGAGVASVILSTVFAIDAKSQQNKIEDAQGRGMPYTQELQDAYSRGQRDNTLAVVFGVAGGALLATSVVMFVVDSGKTSSGERAGARVLPVVSPGGAGAAVIYHF